jgi:hypothetical protein
MSVLDCVREFDNLMLRNNCDCGFKIVLSKIDFFRFLLEMQRDYNFAVDGVVNSVTINAQSGLITVAWLEDEKDFDRIVEINKAKTVNVLKRGGIAISSRCGLIDP